MHRHRLPEINGHEAHFEPNYTLRYAAAWVAGIVALVFLVIDLWKPHSLEVAGLETNLISVIIRGGTPLVLGGAMMYLRGQYLVLDRRNGQILRANGFSGHVFSWETVGEFDPTGTMRFQYCQAELQALCVMTYQVPAGTEWVLLHVYTDQAVARESARCLRQWESRLSVTEIEDQSALQTARGTKPLVD